MSTPVHARAAWASLSRSLTGPTSINLAGWLGTLVPATVLVIVQEATTPFASFLFVLASALVQQALDGLLAVAALATQRMFPRTNRLLIRFLLWTGIGVGRGLIGGAWAAAFADVSPDFGYRIAFWLLVTWAWMPTLGYTLAQLDVRRELLGRRDAEQRALIEAEARDDARQGGLRAQLLDALRAGVAPAVEEVRVRLLRLGSSLDAAATREIGARITGIVEETARIVHGPRRHGSGSVTEPQPRVSLWAAIAVSQQRPFRVAGVMTVGMATLLLPSALHVGGPVAAIPVAAGIAASVAVVSVGSLVEQRVTLRSLTSQLLAFVLRVTSAGALGAVTTLVLGDLVDAEVAIAAALFPVVAGLAAAIVPTIIGLRRANEAVRVQITRLRTERRHLEARGETDEQRVRSHVAQLLHGPIQGRLSACAMALSFHAAAEPRPDAERTAFITASVLDHLEAVARDLEALAVSGDLREARPGEGGGAPEGRG